MAAKSSIVDVAADANVLQLLNHVEGAARERSESAARAEQKAVPYTLPKFTRILKSSHFQSLLRSSRRLCGTWLCIDFRLKRSFTPKLGITISKRYGKAHDRNRLRRLIKETYRQLYSTLPPTLEMNVYPRVKAKEIPQPLTLSMIQSDLQGLLAAIVVPPS